MAKIAQRQLMGSFLSACYMCGAAIAADTYSMHVGRKYMRAYMEMDTRQPGFTCVRAKDQADKLARIYPGKELYLMRLTGRGGGCSVAFTSSDLPPWGVLRLRNLFAAAAHDCAEVIITRSGSITRIRSGSGKVKECVSGENPLLVQVGDKTVPLLWLEYWRNGVSDDESLDAFATTEDVTVDDAAAVFSELSRRFPAATVHLDIRPIPWFPYNTHVPVYFPYLEAFEPPTEVQNSLFPHIDCDYTRTGPKCEGSGRWKKQ